jgi:transposase-like protein
MRGRLIRSERWTQEAALDERNEAIFRDSRADLKRSYAAIAREHGISDQRVRQIVHRERGLAAQFRSGTRGLSAASNQRWSAGSESPLRPRC